MKPRWIFEKPQSPIDSPKNLVRELYRFAQGDPGALPPGELLANVQHFGGWEGDELRRVGIRIARWSVRDPMLLRILHDCDSRIFEGDCAGAIWDAALDEIDLPQEAIENLLRSYERPARLGGAPFDWFLANHSAWPHELLLRFGVNVDCEAPPLPRFLEKMLAYEIPTPLPTETFPWGVGNGLLRTQRLLNRGERALGTLPAKSILAAFAQEVMSESVIPHDPEHLAKFSVAGRHWLRSRLLLELIAELWTHALCTCPMEDRDLGSVAEIEKTIEDWIPEIREDERFLWALDMSVQGCINTLRMNHRLRLFERLRGASVREKPIIRRARFTGSPIWAPVNRELAFLIGEDYFF